VEKRTPSADGSGPAPGAITSPREILKVAKAMGLSVPEAFLIRAGEAIE